MLLFLELLLLSFIEILLLLGNSFEYFLFYYAWDYSLFRILLDFRGSSWINVSLRVGGQLTIDFFNLEKLDACGLGGRIFVFYVILDSQSKIHVNHPHVDGDAVVHAFAEATSITDRKPVCKCKVYGLSNIETEVKSSMVSFGPTYYKLTLIMNGFDQLNAIVHQRLGMDKSIFVPYELRAPLVVERELALHEFFKFLVTAEVYPIPEFWLAVMKIVDAIEIHVLFVPSENRLPGTNIHVGIRNSRNFLIAKSVTKK